MPNDIGADWERLLSSASRLQEILPDAVLVGGTAAALYARHRYSEDADHVLTDLRERFDAVLADLESVAGWQTARITRPVLIPGNLDGIETGVRQLIRSAPRETTQVERAGRLLTLPTLDEILRIKGDRNLRGRSIYSGATSPASEEPCSSIYPLQLPPRPFGNSGRSAKGFDGVNRPGGLAISVRRGRAAPRPARHATGREGNRRTHIERHR